MEQLLPNSKCIFCGSRCQKCASIDLKKTKNISYFLVLILADLEKRCSRLFTICGSGRSTKAIEGTPCFHNLSYDRMFLLQYLLFQAVQPFFVIYMGSKLQMFRLKQFDIRVINLFNFLPMAWSKLPQAGFSDQRCFPYFFKSKENFTYVWPYPPLSTWCDVKMKIYDIFDFQKEMLAYCRSDVDILRRACLIFKDRST